MIAHKGKKVVYLLGAGASANALPIVRGLPAAMRRQPAWINSLFSSTRESPAMGMYKGKLEKIADESERYGSLDTYARALYMLKNESEFADLKIHLGLFFILEQAIEERTYAGGREDTKPEEKDQIDKRYMTWLAQIQDDDGIFSPRVRILSWNYDLQIEHAVGLYQGISNLSAIHQRKGFSIYPPSLSVLHTPQADPTLIHLNGVAGHLSKGGNVEALYSGLLGGRPGQLIHHILQYYFKYCAGDKAVLGSMGPSINFAWESSDIPKAGVEIAKKYMQEAEVLVVIGYSFPPFNRSVDLELIDAFRKNKNVRIHIQNPNMTPENFRHLMGITSATQPSIAVDTDKSQFYLPPELFY